MPFISFFLTLSFFLCSNLYAQKKTLDEVVRDGIPGEVYELSEYPDAVYHWLTKESANKLAHQFQSHKNV